MRGPLDGIRAVDFSRTLAGAEASAILASLGAEVIMIESPRRAPGGIGKGGLPATTVQGVDGRYNYEVRGKKSLLLDYQSPQGREVFYDLVKVTDVVINNWRPGTAEKAGLGYNTLSRVNPRVVCCEITGYGSQGPYRDRPSYDIIAAAHAGVMSFGGEPGRSPLVFGLPIVDMSTGMNAAHGVTAALYEREKTGRGQRVEACLMDVALSLLIYFPTIYQLSGSVLPPPGRRMHQVALSGVLPTKDGHISMGIITDRHWGPFCQAVGRPQWAQDPRFATEKDRAKNKDLLWSLVEGVFQERTAREWEDALARAGVPAAPVLTLDQVLADPHVREGDMFVTIEGAEGKPVQVLSSPIRFSASPRPKYGPAAKPGQHTEEILTNLLAYPPDRVRQLQSEGVI